MSADGYEEMLQMKATVWRQALDDDGNPVVDPKHGQPTGEMVVHVEEEPCFAAHKRGVGETMGERVRDTVQSNTTVFFRKGFDIVEADALEVRDAAGTLALPMAEVKHVAIVPDPETGLVHHVEVQATVYRRGERPPVLQEVAGP